MTYANLFARPCKSLKIGSSNPGSLHTTSMSREGLKTPDHDAAVELYNSNRSLHNKLREGDTLCATADFVNVRPGEGDARPKGNLTLEAKTFRTELLCMTLRMHSFVAFSPSSPAGRTTRIIDPDGDEDGRRYESSNTLPDLTSRMHEAKSSPEANRGQMLRIRRSNLQLGDGRIKVSFVYYFALGIVLEVRVCRVLCVCPSD